MALTEPDWRAGVKIEHADGRLVATVDADEAASLARGLEWLRIGAARSARSFPADLKRLEGSLRALVAVASTGSAGDLLADEIALAAVGQNGVSGDLFCYDSHQAAKFLDLSERSVRRHASEGRIPGATRLGGCWTFPLDTLIDLRNNPKRLSCRRHRPKAGQLPAGSKGEPVSDVIVETATVIAGAVESVLAAHLDPTVDGDEVAETVDALAAAVDDMPVIFTPAIAA